MRRGASRVLLGIALLGLTRCGLGDGASKHRCVTRAECNGSRQCVDGWCRDGSGGGGGSSGGGSSGGGSSDGGSSGGGGSSGSAGFDSAGNGGEADGCGETIALPDGFCIDATEVSRAAYAAWLATSPGNPMNAGCETNPTFEPGCSWPQGSDDLPATCVDWCDAYAYCNGTGKRLCGAIGGGPTDYTKFHSAIPSEWQAACSSGGKIRYPYGDASEQGRCVDRSVDVLRVSGSTPLCRAPAGAYACLFDMSGNVWEWENSCDSEDATASCRLRGGSVLQPVDFLFCAYDAYAGRLEAGGEAVGFRCCSDACP